MCTHIPCCGPWRAGEANRRPPPSAAIDCLQPSPIPFREQHPRSSFLSRSPLLYSAAARASSLSYRFQCPCKPEERTEMSKTLPFCKLIFHTSPCCIGSKRDPDRSPECQSDLGSFCRSRRVFAANDRMTDQSVLKGHFTKRQKDCSFLFFERETNFHTARNRRSSHIYIDDCRVYI